MTSRPSRPPAQALGWAALVVLAGLFAMHGVGMHGTMAGHEMAASPAVSTSSVSVVGQVPDPPHVMTQCLTVLSLGLVLALGLLGPGRTPRLPGQPRRPLVVRPRGRDPDPPDLLLLSIRRC